MNKDRLTKGFYPAAEDYQDYFELFEEDVMDEEIARDMHVDIETVQSIKKDFKDEEMVEGPSVFFKATSNKKKRRKS